MFLFKCSRPGDRSGGRFVPREDHPESGFVPREDDAESGFVPREDDPESGCSGRDDGRCLPEKVKKLTSHDVYVRSWVEEGEVERAPLPANGRPPNYVDEVFCFEVERGETFSDSDYSPSLSADGATCRMSGNAYEATADCVVTFPMFPVGQMRLPVDSVVCEMGDVAFEASADGAVSSPMLSFGQIGLSGNVSVSLSVGDAFEAPADSVTYTPAIPAIQTRPSDEFSACEIIDAAFEALAHGDPPLSATPLSDEVSAFDIIDDAFCALREIVVHAPMVPAVHTGLPGDTGVSENMYDAAYKVHVDSATHSPCLPVGRSGGHHHAEARDILEDEDNYSAYSHLHASTVHAVDTCCFYDNGLTLVPHVDVHVASCVYQSPSEDSFVKLSEVHPDLRDSRDACTGHSEAAESEPKCVRHKRPLPALELSFDCRRPVVDESSTAGTVAPAEEEADVRVALVENRVR